MGRPGWTEYYLNLLDGVAARSTCDRGRNAAIITTATNDVVSTGYCGSPRGTKHCDDVGHFLVKTRYPSGIQNVHCIRTNHAEMNAIAQAARKGISVNGCILYTKLEPCFNCAKLIVQCGIARVVAYARYKEAYLTRMLFEETGVELIVIKDKLDEYETRTDKTE